MKRGSRPSALIYAGAAALYILASAAIAWLVFDLRSGLSDGGTSITPNDRFEQRVREYLENNPEVIVQSLQRREIRKRNAAQEQLKTVLSDRADEILRDPDSPESGNREGDVTLVEFTDYNCPYCRRMAPLIAETEKSDRGLRVVYKEIPILGANSVFAAKAALAARKQGKYIEFHRALMDAKGVAAEGLVLAVAAKVGLDVDRLRADMEQPPIQAAIDRNLALARALGINGTPTFVAGDQIVSGAIGLEPLQQMIRRAREAAK